VRRDLAQWLAKWQSKYERLCAWAEDNFEETLTYYRLPLAHHKHMTSSNMLEHLNQEIKRRTHVVRIFLNRNNCLQLVRALAVETHENWLEATRYLNMEHLREHKKEVLRKAASPASSHRPPRGSAVLASSRPHRAAVGGARRSQARPSVMTKQWPSHSKGEPARSMTLLLNLTHTTTTFRLWRWAGWSVYRRLSSCPLRPSWVPWHKLPLGSPVVVLGDEPRPSSHRYR
jgi:hypothetical protein